MRSIAIFVARWLGDDLSQGDIYMMMTNIARQQTNQYTYTQAVIAASNTESSVIELPSQSSPVTIFLPANYAGSKLYIKLVTLSGDYVDLCDPASGSQISLSVASAPCAIAVLPADLLSLVTQFKFVSDVAQSTDCVIQIQSRTFL